MTTQTQQTRSAEAMADLDRKHVVHPCLDSSVTDRVVMMRGEGCRLWDANGKEYLDGSGGLSVVTVGHGRKELAEVAAEQMQDLAYFTSFWHFTNDKAVLLAERLAELAPAGLSKVFYTNGGSEGVETAIKAARLFHYRRGEQTRKWILSREFSYHGVSYGGLTATGAQYYHHPSFGSGISDVHHLTAPYPFHEEMYDGRQITDYLVAELEETIERIGAENIAAMIGESIISHKAALVAPDDYWPRMRAVLRRHGILMIADEVVTGFGRTGSWFASETAGMDPDIIVTAKAITGGYMPFGAVMMREDIGDTVASDDGFAHGFTYNGHPVACAVALRTLAILDEESLVTDAARKGDLLRAQLAPLLDNPLVGEVRGIGLSTGIEFVSDPIAKTPFAFEGGSGLTDIVREDYGVIGRGLGSLFILTPPLVISDDQISRMADAVKSAVARVRPDGTFRG
ncbi:aminotransferase family protein [Rhodococcus sp. MEB064]|uniref:aminotransferase family protein n=1 Tax=Rhodococcus sp. MEB064 TaxID=1587522 RepID=UPI0005ABD0E1|nr:aspartate aminotransferase family protein [Rhodococcus sp. MEB064]KIQ08018.1 hypothetical protein RU01_21675 [Rhodococcus sp. MEB064]